MRCPRCSAAVADGTAICPHCDEILDGSFLGAENAAKPSPPVRPSQPPPSARMPSGASSPAAPRPASAAPPRPVGSAPPPPRSAPAAPRAPSAPARPAPSSQAPRAADPELNLHTIIGHVDQEVDVHTQIGVAAAAPRAPRAAARADVAASIGLDRSAAARELQATVAEAKAYLRRMGATGRFTLYMFSVVFVAALIPWTYRAGVGYDEGVTTSEGFGVFLLAAIGASVHLLRYRRRMPGKIGLALLTLLAAVAAPVLMAYLLSEIGDIEEQIRPLPQFGFYLAALASALATLGSLVCLKDVR